MNKLEEVLQNGMDQARQGRFQEACMTYEQGLSQFPQCAQIHSSLGAALANLGHEEQAEKHYHTALALQDNQPETWNNLGVLYQKQKQPEKAKLHFERALALRPDYFHALNNLASLLLDMNRPEEAWTIAQKVTLKFPDKAQGWNNLGAAYRKQDKLDKALPCLTRAIELDPNCALAHMNLACVFRAQNQIQQAILSFQRAIQANPDYTAPYVHLASLMAEQHQYDQGITLYQQALERDSTDAQSHFNLSTLYLRLGRYSQAWDHYQWRRQCYPFLRYRHPLEGRPWQGEPLQGQRLLVYSEQGLGDSLQCLRYLRWARQQGAFVIFEMLEPLWRLLKNHPDINEPLLFDPEHRPQLPYNLHTSIMDLPALAQTTLETIPNETPYLNLDRQVVQQWQERLHNSQIKVGVVWAGNPKHAKDAQRSIPLQQLAHLIKQPGYSFFSLQKGLPAKENEDLARQLPWVDLAGHFQDFYDTAHAIGALDLVITVDTSVAHLAGALGKPVWILLDDQADWRWHLETSRSPWYPTARLFRQSQTGNWRGVIQRVTEALNQLQSGWTGDVSHSASPSVQQQRNQVMVQRLQQQAVHSLRQGDHHAALRHIDRALTLQADQAQLHLTKAVVLEHLQRPQLAQRSYRDTLQIDRLCAHAWNNLAILQQQQGHLREAIGTCQEGLDHLPQCADLHHSLAYCLHQDGQVELAEVHYQQAGRLNPQHAEAANHLGVLLAQQERWDEAMACYQTALQRDPNYAEAANNYGLALRGQGDLEAAQAQFRQALMAQPGFAEAHYNLAGLLHQLGRHDQAVIHCHRALKLRPDYGAAHNQLGIILHAQGQHRAALQAHTQAVRLDPEDAEFNNNLAILLKEDGQFEHAECHYLQAIGREPGFCQAHYNLGNLYRDWKRIPESRRCFDRAIACNPNYADAHWNRAIAALLDGDLDQGWQDYHWRHQTSWAQGLYPHRYQQPQWDGRPFPKQRLLVYCEQGQGDAIQFVRYLSKVKALGGTVLLETWPGLQRLFKSAAGIDELYVTQADHGCQVEFDWVISIMDLPYVFRTGLTTIPSQVPYLQTDNEHVQQWRQRFRTPNLKVGLVWAGSPKHGNDALRSVALHRFAELLNLQGVSFFSLQKGPAIEQLADLPPRQRPADLGSTFQDFHDTAHAIAALDLVITVDTALAHLAGALRKPIWTLLPFAPDWRWMTGRSDSPWYPSMRLYRQTKRQDWNPVFEQLAVDLTDWIDRHHQ